MSRFRPVIAAGVLLLFFSSPGLTAEKISQDERYSKALYFYREELLSQAEEEIENLLSENPGHFEAQNLYREIKKIKARKLFLSALIYYEEKEFSSAREARKKGLSLMPEVLDDIAAENILKIKDLLVSQKALEARRETEKLSFLAPQDERVRDLKKLIESSFFRQLLAEVKKENKKYYATYFNQAQAHYGNQEYLLALGKITEALRYMPEEKEGRDLKADIEDKLTRTEEVSLKRKEKAEKLMPRLIFLHEKYKYREAFKLSRRILRYNPNQEEARNIQRQDGAVLARSVLDRALEKYRKGKKKKAAKLIARAREYNLEVLKERSRDLSNQADTLLAEKNEKQGYELLNFALLLDPENVLARGLLEGEESGLAEYWEMYRRGDYAKLKEKMEELKAKKPGSKKVEFMEHLVNAQLFLDQAEFKQAREDLVHAVRIDPLHPEVWQFFERLEEVIEIMGL